MALFSIELHRYRIPGMGRDHYFWVKRNLLTDQVVAEAHGFAWDREEGRWEYAPVSAIFGISDVYQLKFGEIDKPGKFFSNKSGTSLAFVHVGTEDEINERWNSGVKMAKFLDTKNIDYVLASINPAGPPASNSNAMAFTLGRAMGFEPFRLRDPESDLVLPAPGWGRDFHREYDDAPVSPHRESGQQNEKEVRPALSPSPNQKSLNDAMRKGRAGGRDAEHASYRTTRFADLAQMTPAAARREIERVKAHDAFGKRYVKGERAAVDYLHALHRVAYPEPTDEGGQNEPDRTSRNMAGGTATGHAPWFGNALAANEAREAGADPTLAGWHDDPRRRGA